MHCSHRFPIGEVTVSDTFCILPFKKLCVSPEGTVRPCSAFNGSLVDRSGSPLSVYNDSLEEIWNSEDMRSIRRDLLEGKRLSRCWQCYQHEEAGYFSTRTVANRNWEKGWLNEEQLTLAALRARSVARGFREVAPSYLLLIVGTLCNLKCRMCPAEASSSINRDPVHSIWAGGPYEETPAGQHWRELGAVVQELLSRPEQLRAIRIYGGEPLIIREVGAILQCLIDAGVARQIEVRLSTNATTTKAPWIKLFDSFKSVYLTASIDGFDKVFEYIRYPARWEKLKHNLDFFRKLPNSIVEAGVTVQAYNVLNLVDLFRYFDEIDMPFSGHSLISPPYLRTQVLPPRARRLAIERLRSYAASWCKPYQQEFVLSTAAGIESYGDEYDEDLLREFMMFTNDLDVSRGQSFRAACPELYELIAQSGHQWKPETVHAKRKSLPILKLPEALKQISQDGGQPLAQSAQKGAELCEVLLPLVPIAMNQVAWDDGVAKGEGDDPFLVFALPERRFVHAVRVECTYGNVTTPYPTLQIFWRESDRNDFEETERSAILYLWPEPREKALTIPVQDTIDQFRIDPDTKPCIVKIHKIVLLVPCGG
jgi:MoaA/NifB/PqqE/SkfB family radical SAM enzyme